MTESERTIPYLRDGDVTLSGDLYLPSGAGPHPVIVGVPGGGWRFGSRKQLAHWGRHLAQQGFAFFAIDYRQALSPTGIFPRNLLDVRAALDFVYREAGSMNVDNKRMAVLGASAGAHLASLAALADLPDAAPLPKLSVLVGTYGVYDLFRHWQSCRADNPAPGEDFTERMLGTTPYDNPKLYFEASPLSHVTYAKNALKVLLLWGADDRDVLPSGQSEPFLTALRQAHFFTRAVPVPGAGHFWFSDEPLDDPRSRTTQVAPAIVRFLKLHLAGQPR